MEAIQGSDALKVYVCNIMTQDGETEGYTVSDHIEALFQHSAPGLFDLCLTNSAPIPEEMVRRYAQEGAEPIRCDEDTCRALGVEVLRRPLAAVGSGFVRHDSGHLARELIQIYAQRFTPASVAALLMSMEAVFSAVGGVIILHETLSVREWVGCGIMLLTIFYVQLPHREPVKREPVKAA